MRPTHTGDPAQPGSPAAALEGDVDAAFDVDPVVAAQRRAERDRRYYVATTPALRAAGLAALVGLVALHNAVFGTGVIGAGWTALWLASYWLGSFALLWRFYRSDARLNLGELFLVVDVGVFALVVYLTGAHQSWLFFLPWVRVCDQSYRGPRRCLVFAHVALLASLAVLASAALVDGARFAWRAELVKLGSIHAVGLYVAATSKTADNLRRRTASAVHRARELIGERDRADGVRRRSEADLQALVDALPDLVVRVDASGRVLDLRGGESWSRELAGERSLEPLFGGRLTRLLHREIAQALELGEGAPIEGHGPARGAAPARDVEARAVRCADDQVLVLVRDISTQVRARSEREALTRELALAHRQAGKAEMATGVLHDVGNALTSVNVSATLIAERVTQSRIGRLKRACELLTERRTDLAAFLTTDERGKALPDYLIRLGEALDLEREELARETAALRQSVEHIREIVAVQQSCAKSAGVLELVALDELIEDALEINDAGLLRHGVEVARAFEPLPPLATDRHKVLQILVNLIGNAKYALTNARVEPKVLTLRIAAAGPDRLHVEVADNGVGIRPEHMRELFRQGFTTKKDGHGFGLHHSALLAKELGGELRAHSDGDGRGATFTLELPRTAAADADAA